MSTPILNAITEKNAAFARLVAAQQAVTHWPRTGDPLPAKLAAEQSEAELTYQAAQRRADDLLQRRREARTPGGSA